MSVCNWVSFRKLWTPRQDNVELQIIEDELIWLLVHTSWIIVLCLITFDRIERDYYNILMNNCVRRTKHHSKCNTAQEHTFIPPSSLLSKGISLEMRCHVICFVCAMFIMKRFRFSIPLFHSKCHCCVSSVLCVCVCMCYVDGNDMLLAIYTI
jgi:hypothetical protein